MNLWDKLTIKAVIGNSDGLSWVAKPTVGSRWSIHTVGHQRTFICLLLSEHHARITDIQIKIRSFHNIACLASFDRVVESTFGVYAAKVLHQKLESCSTSLGHTAYIMKLRSCAVAQDKRRGCQTTGLSGLIPNDFAYLPECDETIFYRLSCFIASNLHPCRTIKTIKFIFPRPSNRV